MEGNTSAPAGRPARIAHDPLFPPPALRRAAAPAPALPRVRVLEAHPFRFNRKRCARVVLAVADPGSAFSLRLAVLATPERVAFPLCRGEAGVSFTDPALSAEIEGAARAAARRAHR